MKVQVRLMRCSRFRKERTQGSDVHRWFVLDFQPAGLNRRVPDTVDRGQLGPHETIRTVDCVRIVGKSVSLPLL
jgi:hypothetical protein